VAVGGETLDDQDLIDVLWGECGGCDLGRWNVQETERVLDDRREPPGGPRRQRPPRCRPELRPAEPRDRQHLVDPVSVVLSTPLGAEQHDARQVGDAACRHGRLQLCGSGGDLGGRVLGDACGDHGQVAVEHQSFAQHIDIPDVVQRDLAGGVVAAVPGIGHRVQHRGGNLRPVPHHGWAGGEGPGWDA